jgi:hypothetical protein
MTANASDPPSFDLTLGESLSLALMTQSEWIIRTVERVKFVDQNTVRRNVIRHFRLPKYPEARPETPMPDGLDGENPARCMLPIFALAKGSFISCDLRDGRNRKIALPPIDERWALSYQVLMSVVARAEPSAADDEELRSQIWEVVKTPFRNAEESLKALWAYRDNMAAAHPDVAAALCSSRFENLSKYLARNYLVFADVEMKPYEDHMISYMLDERFADRRFEFEEAGMQAGMPSRQRKLRTSRLLKQLGLKPHLYFHPWPISGAGSSHLEIAAPEGVDFGTREVHLPQKYPMRHRGTSSRYARFLAPRSVSQGEGFARLEVHPGSGVMRTAGPMIGGLFAFLLLVVAIGNVRPSLAATLLLIIPSLASLVAARPGEHPYVTRVVRGVRYMTLFPIMLSSLAVAVLAAGLPHWLLYVLLTASVILTGLLYVGARRLKIQTARVDLIKNDLTRVA